MTRDKNLDCTKCPAFSICPEKPVREDYTNETEYLIDLESGVWDCRKTVEKLCKVNEELRLKWLQATDEGTSWARLKNLENTNEQLKQEKAQYIEMLKEWENLVCVGLSEGCCPSCKECLFGELKEKTDNILREVVK